MSNSDEFEISLDDSTLGFAAVEGCPISRVKAFLKLE